MPNDGTLEYRLEQVEKELRDSIATRDYVKAAVTDGIRPLEKVVTELTNAVRNVENQNTKIYAAHDKLLEERAQREKDESKAKQELLEAQIAELKSNTWVKRNSPTVVLCGVCFAILKGIIDYIIPALVAMSHLPKP